MDIRHVLVILADDAGHRALPVRLPGPERQLWRLLSRPPTTPTRRTPWALMTRR
jgi:hypothetical protein